MNHSAGLPSSTSVPCSFQAKYLTSEVFAPAWGPALRGVLHCAPGMDRRPHPARQQPPFPPRPSQQACCHPLQRLPCHDREVPDRNLIIKKATDRREWRHIRRHSSGNRSRELRRRSVSGKPGGCRRHLLVDLGRQAVTRGGGHSSIRCRRRWWHALIRCDRWRHAVGRKQGVALRIAVSPLQPCNSCQRHDLASNLQQRSQHDSPPQAVSKNKGVAQLWLGRAVGILPRGRLGQTAADLSQNGHGTKKS